MKVGDLVFLTGSKTDARALGTIISPCKIEDWWDVLVQGGHVIHWPESQLETVK